MKIVLVLVLSFSSYASTYSVIDDYIKNNVNYLNSLENIKTQELGTSVANQKFVPRVNLYADLDSYDDTAQVIAADTTNKKAGIEIKWNAFRSFSDMQGLQSQRLKLKAKKEFVKVSQYGAEMQAFTILTDYMLNQETIEIIREKLNYLFKVKSISSKKVNGKNIDSANLTRVKIEIINTHNLLNSYKSRAYSLENQIKERSPGVSFGVLTWPWSEELKTLKYEKLIKHKSKYIKTPLLKYLEFESEAARKDLASEQLKRYGDIDLEFKRWSSFLDGQNKWESSLVVNYTIPLYAGDEYKYNSRKKIQRKMIAKKRKENMDNKIKNFHNQIDFDLAINIKNFEEQLKIVKVAQRLVEKKTKELVKNKRMGNDTAILDLNRYVGTKKLFFQSQQNLILAMLSKCHYNNLSYKNCLPK